MPKISQPPTRVNGGTSTALHMRMGLKGVRLHEWPSVKAGIRRMVPIYLESRKEFSEQDAGAVRLLLQAVCEKFPHYDFQQYRNHWPLRDYIRHFIRSRIYTFKDGGNFWPKSIRVAPDASDQELGYAEDVLSLHSAHSVIELESEAEHWAPDWDQVSVIDLCSDDPPMPQPPTGQTIVKMESEPVEILDAPLVETRRITTSSRSIGQTSTEAPERDRHSVSGAAAATSQSGESSRRPRRPPISAPARFEGTARARGRDDIARFLAGLARPLPHLLPFLNDLGITNESDLAELSRMEERNAWLDDAAEKRNRAARPGTVTVSPFDLLRLKRAISAKGEAGKENASVV